MRLLSTNLDGPGGYMDTACHEVDDSIPGVRPHSDADRNPKTLTLAIFVCLLRDHQVAKINSELFTE